MLHPGVKDAGAVGRARRAQRRGGRALRGKASDPGLTAEALLEHCAKHLTGYKLPRRIEFRDQLPKTPIGKVLRRQLKAEATRSRG